MPPTEHTQIETIFDEVVVIADPEQRQAALAERCDGNAHLFERVQSLLNAYAQGEFLETPVAELELLEDKIPSLLGQTVGDYRLLELLASGGMGDVYMARKETSPHDYVAVKLLGHQMDHRHGLARFELEQSLLRRMDHTGIVRFIDSGRTAEGRHYFAMELVRGLAIDHFCDRGELAIEKRLELAIQICQAIEHAHRLGIVHRDLKPANILVQQSGGRAEVKIIDFGVAKSLGAHDIVAASLTRAELLLGTPAFMSPEQLDWSGDVSAQSDVYSIGAVLYKLLVGTTPLDAQLKPHGPESDYDTRPADILDIPKLRQALLHSDPPRPSEILIRLAPNMQVEVARLGSTSLPQLQRILKHSLDWVLLKALAPRRSDRYPSAASLAADLQAVLEERPTSAGPHSLADRLKKWSKRKSNLLKNAAIGCLVLAVATGFGWAKFHRDRLEGEKAVVASQQQFTQQQLQQRQYVADLRQAATAVKAGDDIAARQLLGKYRPGESFQLFDTFALRYLIGLQMDSKRISLGHQHDILDMDLSPDGTLLASCDSGGQILVCTVDSLEDSKSAPVATLDTVEKEVTRIRFSPDGKLLACTGQEAKVRLWKTDSWEMHVPLRCNGRTVNGLVWSPDGRFLAAGDREGGLIVWEASTWERLPGLPRLSGPLRAINWSPDGKTFAVAEDKQVSLWQSESWQLLGRVQCQEGVLAVEFSPDSQQLVIGGYFPELLVVDVGACEIEQRLPIAQADVWSVHFLGDDALVVGLGTGRVRYFDRTGREKQWRGFREATAADSNNRIRRIVPLIDGRHLLAASQEDRQLATLDRISLVGFDSIPTPDSILGVVLPVQPKFPESFQVTRECRPAQNETAGLTAIAGRDGHGPCIGLYELSTGKLINRIHSPARVRQLHFSPDGRLLSICGPDALDEAPGSGRAVPLIFHTDTQQVQALSWPPGGEESRSAFTDSGKLLVVCAYLIHEIACVDSATGELIRTNSLSSNFISLCSTRDGQQVLIGQIDRLSCFAADLSKLLWSAPSPEMIVAIEECHDGRTIACLCYDGKIRLWDKDSHELLYELPYQGSAQLINFPTFWLGCPDPNTLIFGGVEMTESIRFQAR